MNRLSNLIVSSETDEAIRPDQGNFPMIDEEESFASHKEPLPKDGSDYVTEKAALPSDAKMKEVAANSLETSFASGSPAVPLTGTDNFLGKLNSSEEKATKCLLNRDTCAKEDTSAIEDSSANSRSGIVKNDLPGRALNCAENAQEILGLSVLDTINTSKIFTVNQNRLSNYSRNFRNLHENTLAGLESKPNTTPKSMYAAAEDSSSDTESVIEAPKLAESSSLLQSAHDHSLETQVASESEEEQIEICCLDSQQQQLAQKQPSASIAKCGAGCNPSNNVLQAESKTVMGPLEISNEIFLLEEPHSPSHRITEPVIPPTVFCSPSQVSPPRIGRPDCITGDNEVCTFHDALRKGGRISLESRERLMEMCGSAKEDVHEMHLSMTQNINGWDSNLFDKDECNTKQKSNTENDLVATDDNSSCTSGYPSGLTTKGAGDSAHLSKPDSHPLDCALQRIECSPRSPLLTKSKDLSKATAAYDLPGKTEKMNATLASKCSNAKTQGSNLCKGITSLHSPSLSKKSHPETKGIPQKSLAETLSNNQRNKPGPKLKGLTIKSKAKTNSETLGPLPAKGIDQKHTSPPVQLSPRLLAKSRVAHLEPPSRSLPTASRTLQQDEENKYSFVVPPSLPSLMLNGDCDPLKNNKDIPVNGLGLSRDGTAEDPAKHKETPTPIPGAINRKKKNKTDIDDCQAREHSSQIIALSKITPKDDCLNGNIENHQMGAGLVNRNGCEMNSFGSDNIGPSKKEHLGSVYPPSEEEQSAQEIQRTFIEVRLSSSSSFTPSPLIPQVCLEKEEGNNNKSSQLEKERPHFRQNTFEEEHVHSALKPVTRTYSMPAQLSAHLREESNAMDVPTHHVQDIVSNVSGERCSHAEMGMLKIVHLSLMNGQSSQEGKETLNSIPRSNTQELPLTNENSSRIADKLRMCRRNYYYYELNWPHDPISSFSVKQRIKSFENLANFDRPMVKAIDIHSTSFSSKLPIGRRLSGGVSAVSATSVNDAVQALRRSLSSYGESDAPTSPRMTKSSTSAALTHLQQNSAKDNKDDSDVEKSDRLPPSSTNARRSKASAGHIRHTSLSRSKLRELRALSMPELDKLCSEDFAVESNSSHFKTQLEITPTARSLGLPIESTSSLNECTELSNLVTGSRQRSKDSSPWTSGSGTPGSASDEEMLQPDANLNTMHPGKSWSIR